MILIVSSAKIIKKGILQSQFSKKLHFHVYLLLISGIKGCKQQTNNNNLN